MTHPIVDALRAELRRQEAADEAPYLQAGALVGEYCGQLLDLAGLARAVEKVVVVSAPKGVCFVAVDGGALRRIPSNHDEAPDEVNYRLMVGESGAADPT